MQTSKIYTLIMYPLEQVFGWQYTKIFRSFIKEFYYYFFLALPPNIPLNTDIGSNFVTSAKNHNIAITWTLIWPWILIMTSSKPIFTIVFFYGIYMNKEISSMLAIWSRPKSFSFLKFYWNYFLSIKSRSIRRISMSVLKVRRCIFKNLCHHFLSVPIFLFKFSV